MYKLSLKLLHSSGEQVRLCVVISFTSLESHLFCHRARVVRSCCRRLVLHLCQVTQAKWKNTLYPLLSFRASASFELVRTPGIWVVRYKRHALHYGSLPFHPGSML